MNSREQTQQVMIEMHRVFWIKIGGKRMHTLSLAGAFFVLASVLKLAESAYQIFVAVNKANLAMLRPDLVTQLFGWSLNAPNAFTGEDILGVLLGPVAAFLFWFGIAIIALAIYQTGKVMLPFEEGEISEEHRKRMHKAILLAKKKR
ncbi:MAG: hypothetical protein V1834_02875 [Candidatus Micrarchaeota archaeon]